METLRHRRRGGETRKPDGLCNDGAVATDTTAEAQAVQYEVYRRLGASRRVELAVRMSEEARAIARAGIASRHPSLSETERHEQLLRTLLGESLYLKMAAAGSNERG